MDISVFLWKAIAGGVVGNTAYDSVKQLLGQGFERFSGYVVNNQRDEFNRTLQAVLETNQTLKENLTQLASNPQASIKINKNINSGTIKAKGDVTLGDTQS